MNIAGPGAPEWLKMVRSGDNFSAYYSADDVNWTQVGSNQSISIGSTAMIGLAVTSHDNSVFNTASFASLSIDTPPVVSGTSGTALSWTEALPPAAPPVITIAPGLSISDASSPQLTAATVAITSGLSSPEDVLGWDHSLAASDGIGVAYSAADGTLSLSGTASLSQYQIVLQSVTYSDTSQNPSTLQRTINFSVTDANGLLSGVTASSQQVIDVTAVDNPPTVVRIAGSDAYTAGNSALLVDAALTVTDPDTASLAGATVSIVGNYASGDVLIFADQNDITGSYSNGVLMLTGNASVASYQSALQSITFASTNNSTATRTVSYVVNDGSLNSASATKLIDVFAPVDVTGVYVKCSTWNTTFLDDLATNGLGSSTLGFRMQTGANQLEPLPWNNLDTIEIVFSGAVNVSQNSLSLIGSPNQAHRAAIDCGLQLRRHHSHGHLEPQWFAE